MAESMYVVAVLVATKSKGAGSYTFLLLIALFGLFYFFVLRPRSQKQKAAREQTKQAVVGDEIATVGGLVGTIVAEDGDRITLSTGNGTELVYLRQAILRKIEPTVIENPADDAHHDEGDAHDSGEHETP